MGENIVNNLLRVRSLIAAAGIVGTVVGAGLVATPAFAWHPVGKITKFVANETTHSQSVDANTEADAVSGTTGDILAYTITVRNDGQPDEDGYNDLAFVEINDTLPTGLELVANPSQRVIKETIPGVLKPGQSVKREYKVRITSTEDGFVIKNQACFVGNSTVNDNKQQGCDNAFAKVKVVKQPPKEDLPKETPKETPKQLPSTGPEAILGSAAGIGTLGYAAVHYHRSKKAVASALKK